MASQVMRDQQDFSDQDFFLATGRTRSIFLGWRLWAIAASAVLLIALGWLLFPRPVSDEALFAAHFFPAPGLPTTLGLQDDPTFAEGMISYKLSEYAAFRDTWQPLLTQHPDNDTLRFYMGVSYLAEDEPATALRYFDPFLLQQESTWQPASRWYAALAYLRESDREKARLLLRSLSAVPGDYQERASRLLAEL